MIFYKIIFYVAIVFVILYLPRIFCWFASLIPQKRLKNEKNNKFAIVIPARNEGDAVLPLFDSFKKQTYSKEYYDVFVVVKDPEDIVIKYAEDYGFTAYVDENQTCKGDCLDSTFKKIMETYPKKHDGFIIIDADCVLKDNFLEEMNNGLANGADVLNAKKIVGNYFLHNGMNSNLITSSNGLIWTFMDDMGNRWKSDHGYTTMTVTTGIFISSKIIEQNGGWIYKETLTEDMEFERDCCVHGWKTQYYSYAQFYMQESPSLIETDKRRKRWMTGLVHSDFIYAKRMLQKKTLHSLIDCYFIFSLWIVYAFVAIELFISILNVILFLATRFINGTYMFSYLKIAFVAFMMIYLAFFALTLVALNIARKDVKLSISGFFQVLFYHPIFYMGYIKIVGRAIIIRQEMEWDAIARVDQKTEDPDVQETAAEESDSAKEIKG